MSKASVHMAIATAADRAGAELVGESPGRITSICSDSRVCETGSLFVALSGENADGHSYVPDAVRRGAVAALVSTEWASRNGTLIEELAIQQEVSFLLVADPLAGLHALAIAHRSELAEPFTIGITGSNGKTTTKELLGSILKQGNRAYVSHGNLNSEIGLPLSVLELSNEYRFGVFEMAMNHPGEMRDLARILRPRLALITNIGTAHIGILGSKQAIAEEKKQIFSQFSGSETAFLYDSEPYYDFLRKDVKGEVLMYGERSTPGFRGARDLGIRGSMLSWYNHEIHLPLPGAYNVRNALAAMAVAVHLGVPEQQIVAGIERVPSVFGRSEVIHGEVTVLQDCYNANPDSIRESVGLLDSAEWPGRKIIVLGDMKELGAYSKRFHTEVLRDVLSAGVEALFLFGEAFSVACTEVVRDPRVTAFTSFERIRDALASYVRCGDLVLIKGSRSMALERLTPYLTTERSR